MVLSVAATTLAPAYCRHRPEQTALYAIIEAHYPRFLEAVEYSDGHLPGHLVNYYDMPVMGVPARKTGVVTPTHIPT